jgi:NAD(P)H-hydrate epimerase
MVVGIGIDIVEIKRISDALKKNNRFLQKVFTSDELKYLEEKRFRVQSVAGGFAAKEAVSKALGTGFRGFGLQDIQVLRDELGKPFVILTGKARSIAEAKGDYTIHLSISHSDDNAIAYAMLEVENISSIDNHKDYKVIDKYYVRKFLKVRDKNGHKGDYGKVLIIAGSSGFYGAAFIATEAAVRAGSGLVTLMSSKDTVQNLGIRLVEAMTANYEEEDRFKMLVSQSDAIAFGPGLGDDEKNYELLKKVINESGCGLVLDADGLNIVSRHKDILKDIRRKVILTPHVGEMARLTGNSIEYIKQNRIEVAEKFARDYDVVLLLKGHDSVITDGINTKINPTGNSAMANGGMGDCLTGIIASLLGQGLGCFEAAACGAYIHGYAGDILAKDMYTVNPTHIIDKLPFVMKEILE